MSSPERRRPRRARRGGALALAVALWSATGGAEPATRAMDLARQRFREAREAYRDGRFAAAASLFEAADRLAPHGSTRFNAATAWEQAGEDARAATGYEAALASEQLDDARNRAARARLDELSGSLARVAVDEPLGALVTVDHVRRTPLPTVFYLRPGSYEVTVDYQGASTSLDIDLSARERLTLDLGFAAPKSTLPVAVPSPEPMAPRLPAPPPPDQPDHPSRTQEVWGWASLGTGVLLVGVASFLGVRFLEANRRYENGGTQDSDQRSDAVALKQATNWAWGGAAGFGAVGTVLVLTSPTFHF